MSTSEPQPPHVKAEEKQEQKALPKGVVLDKDGKPCRTCTSLADWKKLTQQKRASSSSSKPPAATATPSPVGPDTSECPPDVEALGRGTWTLLHSLTATYPPTASQTQQSDMRTFLGIFSKIYPCWVCADDFRTWMDEDNGMNKPRLSGRQEFGTWMCEAHNAVNRKLGKKEFDCSKWEERWRTGWKDGRCD